MIQPNFFSAAWLSPAQKKAGAITGHRLIAAAKRLGSDDDEIVWSCDGTFWHPLRIGVQVRAHVIWVDLPFRGSAQRQYPVSRPDAMLYDHAHSLLRCADDLSDCCLGAEVLNYFVHAENIQ